MTLAGGVVLDPEADRRLFRKKAQMRFLERRAEAPGSAAVAVETLLERDRVVRSVGMLLKSNFSGEEITGALDQLRVAGKAIQAADFVVDSSCWNALRTKAMHAIDTHHEVHPEQPGLPLSQLRSALENEPGANELLETLISSLPRDGFVQAGTALKRAAHRAALPPHLQAAGAKVRATLSAKPLDPPSRKELAPDAATQQALRFLIQTGEAVELSPDVVLLAASFAKATDSVRKHLRERGSGTVSDLRQVIGASRRIVVPLLEKLDREGITRRQGDLRVLK